jgi:hypothetical protein
MSMDMTAAEEQYHASWCPADEGATAADRAHDEQSHPPPALPVSAITPALSFPMGAQLPMLPPLEQPHAWMRAAHFSSAGAYSGMSTGGGGQWPFCATSATVEGEGEGIQPASFLSAEEGARAHDAWAARMAERAARFQALSEQGTACALSPDADQRSSLSASAWGQGQQQRGDADEGEQPMAAECTAATGGGRASHAAGPAECTAVKHRAQTAAVERGSGDDCAQYVGVYYNKHQSATNPFYAHIRFGSKDFHICSCVTAEAAARAYDAIARMIPDRKLNFPTTSPVAAFGAVHSPGAISSKSELLVAIAARRQPKQPRGAMEYVGVWRSKASANPFRAQISVDGQRTRLGAHPTAEAAARAYDVVARTIPGRTLNFPVATAGTPQPRVQAAACAHAAPFHPAQPIEQQVQPSARRWAPPQPGADDGGMAGGHWPFCASAVVEGESERIQPASFLSAEESARAQDAWVASMAERVAHFQAPGKHGTACAPSPDADQRPSLGASAWGTMQQQRGAADEGEQPMAAEYMAAAGGGRVSHAAGPIESTAAIFSAQTAAALRAREQG